MFATILELHLTPPGNDCGPPAHRQLVAAEDVTTWLHGLMEVGENCNPDNCIRCPWTSAFRSMIAQSPMLTVAGSVTCPKTMGVVTAVMLTPT